MKITEMILKENVQTGINLSDNIARQSIKQVDERIAELEENGEENHEYAALCHISTVLEIQINAPLSQRANIRTAFVILNNKIVAAGSMWIPRKSTEAEIMNVGSIERGAGSQVINALEKEAKIKGVKKIVLTSTAKSFYERLGYKKQADGNKLEKYIG